MNIREATPVDLPAIVRLGSLLIRLHHASDPKRFLPATPESERQYALIGAQLAEPTVVVRVADLEGEVVGFAYAGTIDGDYTALHGPVGALYDITVDPAHRGRGIGRMLLDATLEELAARGAPRVLLSTAEWNEAGQRLFARAGFRRTMIEMMRELDSVAP
jgi:ribosomal protein S18 acetylase RimI-like enzyme